jgi:hypothetical protein
MLMKIDIKETLRFFDERHPEDRGHASGVVGIIGEDLNAAAFKHYMKHQGFEVEVMDEPVTTGKQKGRRLDRWIYVKNNRKEILYQTEIKNWSSWAIGGKVLPVNASDTEIARVTKHHWQRQGEEFVGGEHPNGITKVLVKMNPPERYSSVTVEPLLIYWMPICKSDLITPFFSISTSDITKENKMKTPFEKLHIFSVSLYLRELWRKGKNYIETNTPNIDGRIKVLRRILK